MPRKEEVATEEYLGHCRTEIRARRDRIRSQMRQCDEYRTYDDEKRERVADERRTFWIHCEQEYDECHQTEKPVYIDPINIDARHIRKKEVGHRVAHMGRRECDRIVLRGKTDHKGNEREKGRSSIPLSRADPSIAMRDSRERPAAESPLFLLSHIHRRCVIAVYSSRIVRLHMVFIFIMLGLWQWKSKERSQS